MDLQWVGGLGALEELGGPGGAEGRGSGGAEDLKSAGCWVRSLLPSPSAPVAAEHVGVADKCYFFSFKCYMFSLWLLAAPPPAPLPFS